MTAFAIGYSLPLTAAVLGLGFGLAKLASVVQKFALAIRAVAGVTLIAVGFYLLATA